MFIIIRDTSSLLAFLFIINYEKQMKNDIIFKLKTKL